MQKRVCTNNFFIRNSKYSDTVLLKLSQMKNNNQNLNFI